MTGPVIYVSRFVPHYRLPVLERLNELLGNRLIVCSGQPPDATFESLRFHAQPEFWQVALRNLWIAGEQLHVQPFRKILQLGPSVILAEESPRSLLLPLLLYLAKRQGVGTLLWGHFSSNNRPFASSHPIDRYRLALARSVDACMCYTDSIAETLRQFIPHEQIFTARNTLDMPRLLELNEHLKIEGQKSVRHRLGLKINIPILTFIGRLIPRKGLDVLLDVYATLIDRGPVTLLIIGDGPEKVSIQDRVFREGWDDVHLLGAITAYEKSAPYLFASDVFVCPGYVGLSVNHAFAFGLPVVTQASPDPNIRFHSPEITYLQPGQNGMIAPHGDVLALANAVRCILDDQDRFSTNALTYARDHLSLSTMVDGLVDGIHYAEQRALSRYSR